MPKLEGNKWVGAGFHTGADRLGQSPMATSATTFRSDTVSMREEPDVGGVLTPQDRRRVSTRPTSSNSSYAIITFRSLDPRLFRK
jgi:hypothetical protein